MMDSELLNLLPPLRRARGDRLYGPDQRHWVDLWKQDGAWLLGHRPEGAATEWKNQVDKGLAAWAPSLWPKRLEPLVKQLLPETTAVRVFRNADRALAFLGGEGNRGPALWRPWEDREAPWDRPGFRGVVWPVLPTGPGQAVALAFTGVWAGSVPDHDITSPAEAAGLVHAAAQVIRYTADPRAAEARSAAARDFDRYLGPSGQFVRRGIWFEAAVPAAEYPALFRAHLAGGFVLNPDGSGANVLPTALSPGEWKAWKEVAK
jgi:hypothetical protein